MSYIMPQEFDFESEEKAYEDHEKLVSVLRHLPSEPLLGHLEKHRKGRKDKIYPIRFMWNCFIAGIVYDHSTFASLRRKLLHRMFDDLVGSLRRDLPGFGKNVAGDSTDVSSYSRGNKNKKTGLTSDPDGAWRKYDNKFVDNSGKVHKSIKKWFGYKLHLLVDANYELPVGFAFTSTNVNDAAPMEKIVERARKKHPKIEMKTSAFDEKGASRFNENQTNTGFNRPLPQPNNISRCKSLFAYRFHRSKERRLAQKPLYRKRLE